MFGPGKSTTAWCKLKLSTPEHTQEPVRKENGADLREKWGGLEEERCGQKREERALDLTVLGHGLHAMLLCLPYTHFVWQKLKYRLIKHH